ncbi:MAG: NTP transferase domain-containing protein [Candidatus Hadarchaeales archaeon]
MGLKAVFITVRMKSTRLPRKALLEIEGKPAIVHLIERMKAAKRPDIVVLCTSTHPDDEVLVETAKSCGIEAFRGSPEDKLDRYLSAAKRYGVEFFVNVDGDDILCDPELVDRTIEEYNKTGADCIFWRNLPVGAAPIGIKVKALEKVCEMKDEKDTEVWGGYFTDSGLFRVEYLEPDEDLKHPEFRMTLDYPEDFEFFKVVFKHLYRPGAIFSLRDIVEFLKRHPEVVAINRGVQKVYEERLMRHARPKWKKGTKIG